MTGSSRISAIAFIAVSVSAVAGTRIHARCLLVQTSSAFGREYCTDHRSAAPGAVAIVKSVAVTVTTTLTVTCGTLVPPLDASEEAAAVDEEVEVEPAEVPNHACIGISTSAENSRVGNLSRDPCDRAACLIRDNSFRAAVRSAISAASLGFAASASKIASVSASKPTDPPAPIAQRDSGPGRRNPRVRRSGQEKRSPRVNTGLSQRFFGKENY